MVGAITGVNVGAVAGVERGLMKPSGRRCLAGLLCALGVLLASAPALPRSIEARIVSVADGDTVRVRTRDPEPVTVRLLYIDAPESDQPWGREARRALQEMVRIERVRIDTRGRDRYARTLGHLRRVSDGLDVNLELVRRGHAWASARGAMRLKYEAAEREARAARRGLWQAPNPMSPYRWRHRARTRQAP
jgi:micrococcal nuclease